MPRFRDRREAGRALAARLQDLRVESAVVLGIPRGGVVVGHEIASVLGAPLDVVVVRKLGYPGHEEAAFGAVGEGDVLVPESLARIPPAEPAYAPVQEAIATRRAEVAERARRYRGGRPLQVEGTAAIVVDDGIATGYTFAAALAVVRRAGAALLVGAAPVASAEGADLVSRYCDELVTMGIAPRGTFFAVSLYYDDFPQVSDDEVVALVGAGEGPPAGGTTA